MWKMQERDKKVGKKRLKKCDHGRRYLETTVDLLFPNHAWNVDPAVIYNGGYDHCRPLRGKSGTCKCRRTGSRIIDDRCYLLQWSGEWGGSYYRTILWCKGQE